MSGRGKSGKDPFEKMLERFLIPIERLEAPVDSLYLLRRDGSFVFCEGYCHPEGGLYGKIIYYPDPGGGVDFFGRAYGCTTKRVEEGETVYVSHPEQIEMHGKIDPGLDPRSPRPVFVEYEMEFPLSDFVGYFDPRHSLLACCSLFPWVEEGSRAAARALGIPWERLGITGSLAFGRYEEGDDDLDLVIQGTMEENRRAYLRIRELSRQPERMVVEFGRWWPMRFYESDYLICPFFVHDRPESSPLHDFSVRVIREEYGVEGVVGDDTYTIYMPPFLELEEVKAGDGRRGRLPLIIYDGALRGEFFRGDILRMTARLVEVSRGGEKFEAALVTLWDNIMKVGEVHRPGSGLAVTGAAGGE